METVRSTLGGYRISASQVSFNRGKQLNGNPNCRIITHNKGCTPTAFRFMETYMRLDIRRWGASNGVLDDLLAEYLWNYEKSLTGSTERINLWRQHGGPSDFIALEQMQATLTQTIEWRKAQRVLIASRWSHTGASAKRLIKRLYAWDDGSTMEMDRLIANQRAKLNEFGSYTPNTPPAPPDAYLHRGDPMGRMSPWEEQELLEFQTERWSDWSQGSEP